MDQLYLKKCQSCPYQQGLIKMIRDPCFECMMSGRKVHPFAWFRIRKPDMRCRKCGIHMIVNGRCALCGAKQTGRF